MGQTARDVGGIVEIRVIGGEEDPVGVFAAHLAHALDPLGGAASGDAGDHGDGRAGIVPLQVRQQGLGAGPVVHAVHQHVDAAALVPVHAAGDLQSVQGRGHLLMFRPQHTPHADGGQGVFDVEIPVHGQVIGVQGLTAPLLDEKAEAVGQFLHLPDGQIAVVPVHAHQHHLPTAPPGGVIHPVKLGRLPADHGPAAVFQQLELALQILLHGGVLLGGDVVLTEVQEHPDVEVLAIDPLHLIRLAGYLGGHIRQAVIPGLGKQPLQVQGLRRGQMGVHVRASAVASGGGAEAHGPARQGVGDGLDHIGGGGFPLGAGDADKGQAVGGIVVKPPGRQALGLADVGDPDAGDVHPGKVRLRQGADGSLPPGHGQILRLEAVALADKEVAVPGPAGIVADTGDGRVPGRRGRQQIVLPEQVLQIAGLFHRCSFFRGAYFILSFQSEMP